MIVMNGVRGGVVLFIVYHNIGVRSTRRKPPLRALTDAKGQRSNYIFV